ncbi:ankyrin repeat-containing domain protein [Tuber brumale]|nr:ankyrin repeat-containing domain protein [Tuber brumale]
MSARQHTIGVVFQKPLTQNTEIARLLEMVNFKRSYTTARTEMWLRFVFVAQSGGLRKEVKLESMTRLGNVVHYATSPMCKSHETWPEAVDSKCQLTLYSMPPVGFNFAAILLKHNTTKGSFKILEDWPHHAPLKGLSLTKSPFIRGVPKLFITITYATLDELLISTMSRGFRYFSLGPIWRERKAARPFGFSTVLLGEAVVVNSKTVEGTNPDMVYRPGRTPLSWAAGCGHEEVVKLLLERNDVDPNMADEEGRTPLSWSAQNGCYGVVKLLLKRRDVDPNIPDIFGWTPFSFALVCGELGVVDLLLDREDVHTNGPTIGSQTPLS